MVTLPKRISHFCNDFLVKEEQKVTQNCNLLVGKKTHKSNSVHFQ